MGDAHPSLSASLPIRDSTEKVTPPPRSQSPPAARRSSTPAEGMAGLTYGGQEVKKVGKYYLTKTLGQGNFSKVKLGIHETTEQRVAVKIMKKARLLQEGLIDQVKREISIMKLIKHPNIVELYEVLSSTTNLYLVMELITGGEIFWKIATEKKLSESVARSYFHELIDALDYCHCHGVYHRDLKPENILLDSMGHLKISDFGLSAQVQVDSPNGVLSPSQRRHAEATLLSTRCGTPQYAAPEIIGNKGYFGAAVDIWACGVILYVFVVGNLPFDEANEADLFRKILQANVTYPNFLSEEVIALLKKIFVVDPTKRISIQDIKQDPWFLMDYDPSQTPPQLDISNLDTEGAVSHAITHTESEAPKKLTSMNAFDLINKAGMLNLTRLIRNTKTQIVKAPSYFTTHAEANIVLFRLRTALDTMSYIGYKFDPAAAILHVTGKSKMKGFLLFDITVSRVTDKVRLVDFDRQTGSILEFWRIFQQLKQSCKDLITKEVLGNSS